MELTCVPAVFKAIELSQQGQDAIEEALKTGGGRAPGHCPNEACRKQGSLRLTRLNGDKYTVRDDSMPGFYRVECRCESCGAEGKSDAAYIAALLLLYGEKSYQAEGEA